MKRVLIFIYGKICFRLTHKQVYQTICAVDY